MANRGFSVKVLSESGLFGRDFTLDRSFFLSLVFAVLHLLSAGFSAFAHKNFLSFLEP
jgi:hypothetical protein